MRSLERGWVAGWGLRDGGEGTISIKQALLSFSDGTGPVNRKFCDTRCKRERVKVDV